MTAGGELDAFRAEEIGTAGAQSIEERIRYVPWLDVPDRRDRHNFRYLGGHPTFRWAERREIVSARQFAIDRRGRCMAGRSRSAALSRRRSSALRRQASGRATGAAVRR